MLNPRFVFNGPRGIPRLVSPQVHAEAEKQTALESVRSMMRQNHVGIYLVMEHDEHQSEYVADHDRRIRFISNFSGSAAFVSIGFDFAELATDSRYYVIADRELSSEWSLRKLGLPGVDSWQTATVKRAVERGVNVGVDPRFINAAVAADLASQLQRFGRQLVPIGYNLIDRSWPDQPDLPNVAAFEQPVEFCGEPREHKIARVRESMRAAGANSLVLYSLEEIAWLLNVRGGDIPYVPVFKAFLILTHKRIVLYTNCSKVMSLIPTLKAVHCTVHNYSEFFPNGKYVAESPVWVPSGGTWGISRTVDAGNVNSLIRDISPVNLMRAVKNETEIRGIYESQLKCSLSIVQYLSWLGENFHLKLNEYDGGEVLRKFREKLPDFRGNSFETISSSGPNASAPHYAPPKMHSSLIDPMQIYLLDSGSHFLQGSTDITRTVHYGEPSREEIRAYTLVLKGQLAVSSLVFPEGTSGAKLDLLARQYLWEYGMDYGHGTGHGIGSYLNIHELPLGIGMSNGPESVLQPGHFVSDEPGYYLDNVFGVRLENDILVVNHSTNPAGRKFYTFDIATVVPYEPKLIDVNLLTPSEIAFINSYHKRCAKLLSPHLHEEHEIRWLKRCTKPL